MSHRLKLTLFVLAFNIVGLAEGYLLRDIGLLWLVAILLVTAWGAVLLSRRFYDRPRGCVNCDFDLARQLRNTGFYSTVHFQS